jgi:hypothetical protein
MMQRISILLRPSIQHLGLLMKCNQSSTSRTFLSYVDSMNVSEFEIKDTTESSTSASYFDILMKFDAYGKLTTQLYSKLDSLSLAIIISPYACT